MDACKKLPKRFRRLALTAALISLGTVSACTIGTKNSEDWLEQGIVQTQLITIRRSMIGL